jgi:hypothetical protein
LFGRCAESAAGTVPELGRLGLSRCACGQKNEVETQMQASSPPIAVAKITRAECRDHGSGQSLTFAVRSATTVGLSFLVIALVSTLARADGPLSKVNHVIIVMQENHSFDNYFGVLPYAPGSPYHTARGTKCALNDHTCLAGLSCVRHADGTYTLY